MRPMVWPDELVRMSGGPPATAELPPSSVIGSPNKTFLKEVYGAILYRRSTGAIPMSDDALVVSSVDSQG